MSLVVRRCTVEELGQMPNLPALIAEYAQESAFAGLGEPVPQIEVYREWERAGCLHCLGAFQDGELVGFLLFLVSVHPRYGKQVASTELYFVASQARKKGAGLLLLREAKRIAKSLGACGLFVGAPVGSSLEVLLPHVGFEHSHSLFFAELT